MEENKAQKQVLADTPKPTCRFCSAPISENAFFCPTCGKKLKEPPFTFSWTKVIINMTLSTLLPPIGIFPGIRHIRKDDQTAKILGLLYIVVTMIATVMMLKITLDYIDKINNQLNSTYLMQDYINNPEGSVEDQVEELQQLGL